MSRRRDFALAALSLVAVAWPLGPVPGGLRQLGEVLPAVPVKGDPSAGPSPRPSHVGVGLGSAPLVEGLLADGAEGRTAPLALGAHDMHASLAVGVGAAAAGERLDPLYLFACLLIDGGVAEVDVPVQARVRVVLVFSVWVRVGCARLSGVHSGTTFLWAGSRGAPTPAGPFPSV
jgi:hypothetical protein